MLTKNQSNIIYNHSLSLRVVDIFWLFIHIISIIILYLKLPYYNFIIFVFFIMISYPRIIISSCNLPGGTLMLTENYINYRHFFKSLRWTVYFHEVQKAWWYRSFAEEKIVLELGGEKAKEFDIRRWRVVNEEHHHNTVDYDIFKSLDKLFQLEYVLNPRRMFLKRRGIENIDSGISVQNVVVLIILIVFMDFGALGIISKWHSLEVTEYYYASFFCVSALSGISWYLFKSKTRVSVIIISIILGGLPLWFFFLALFRFQVIFFGTEHEFEYRLADQTKDTQTWICVNGDEPKLEYFTFVKSNQIFTDIGTTQKFILKQSLGMTLVNKKELKKVRIGGRNDD